MALVRAALPSKSVRIDLLAGAEGLALGEFTPRPGGYHGFSDETDHALGMCFGDAETRLFDDLMVSKQFAEYQQLLTGWPMDNEGAQGASA